MGAAANKIVPVTLELGGKSPLIVCPDADLDHAVELAANAIFPNSVSPRTLRSCASPPLCSQELQKYPLETGHCDLPRCLLPLFLLSLRLAVMPFFCILTFGSELT